MSAFEELRAEYAANFPAHAAAVRRLLQAHADGDAEALAELRRFAHRLHGSGGSYGFPELSVAAAALELGPAEGIALRAEALIAVLESDGPRSGEA